MTQQFVEVVHAIYDCWDNLFQLIVACTVFSAFVVIVSNFTLYFSIKRLVQPKEPAKDQAAGDTDHAV